MSVNVPKEFKPFAKYLDAGLSVESQNPTVAAMMKNFFYQTCQDYSQEYPVAPEAKQFLQTFGATVPPMPPNGVQETQNFADNLFLSLTTQFEQGKWRLGMVKDFQVCAFIYDILEGPQNEESSRKCKAVAVKINKMLRKGIQNAKNEGGAPGSTSGGGPPVFTPQGGSSGGPPVFTPQGGSSGGPPVFTPQGGSSGGPPVFTPQGGSSGGPPVFTPQGGSSGGPPVFTPQGGSSGGPPVFTPQGSSSGGPPIFTPQGSSGGPPVFTPQGKPPVFTPNNSGASPSYNPPPAEDHFSIPVDPNFDANSAKHLLQSLGYNIVNSSSLPPLNQQSYMTVESYLDYAVKGIKDSDKDTCLNYLKDALNSWNSGGYA